jgi:signal transduction histidine kinase
MHQNVMPDCYFRVTSLRRRADVSRSRCAYACSMSAIYAWLRRHPTLVDSVLAGMLALLALAPLLRRPWPMVPITLLVVVPVAVRRRFPAGAFATFVIAGLWQLAINQPSGADVAVLVLLYTVAAYRPRRLSIPALITCLIGSAVALIVWVPAPTGYRLIIQVLLFGGLFGGMALLAWVLGDSMRYRRGYYAALEDRAARLEAERDAQAKIAAAAERARIARELHDVIAHHVSVMVVQADGAGYALRSDATGTAEAALQAISSTGRQALAEMRRLLGVLRTAGDQAGLTPVPGLGELRELLDQARSAGLAVTYTLSGTPRELPEGAELAAYRVVQESLTNTRKHAGLAASAAVVLRYEPDGLTVEVTDDGLAIPAGDTGGHGLAGMRERIQMYGGTVQAGPLPAGGFRVLARLPCPHSASAAPPASAEDEKDAAVRADHDGLSAAAPAVQAVTPADLTEGAA